MNDFRPNTPLHVDREQLQRDFDALVTLDRPLAGTHLIEQIRGKATDHRLIDGHGG